MRQGVIYIREEKFYVMNYPSTHKSLLERVRNGEEIAWSEFYDRYKGIIRAVGSLYHFNEDEQDDLLQRVMVKFLAHAKTYVYRQGVVKFRTYLARIIRSEAVDYIRSSAARRNAEESAGTFKVEDDSFEEEFMNEWRKAVLAEALEELRSRVKFKTYQAFQLYGLQNRPSKDVAALLEISEHQVHLAKSRCAEMLREIIARYNTEDGALKLNVQSR